MEEKTKAASDRVKLFIKRERIRRDFLQTKPGETICLNSEKVDILLAWIRELETTVRMYKERKR